MTLGTSLLQKPWFLSRCCHGRRLFVSWGLCTDELNCDRSRVCNIEISFQRVLRGYPIERSVKWFTTMGLFVRFINVKLRACFWGVIFKLEQRAFILGTPTESKTESHSIYSIQEAGVHRSTPFSDLTSKNMPWNITTRINNTSALLYLDLTLLCTL